MRKPNICNNSVSVVEEEYKPAQRSAKDEGRVSLMRRMLGGSRRKDGSSSSSASNNNNCTTNKQFGLALRELPLTSDGIPLILNKMCSLIEKNGFSEDGLFKSSNETNAAVNALKAQINRTGDLNDDDVDAVVMSCLLVQWLKDLSEPLIPEEDTTELIGVMHKYEGDPWWGPVCHAALSSGGSQCFSVLKRVLGLLHSYTQMHPSSLGYIPHVFCPLLTCAQFDGIPSPERLALTATLIQDFPSIFQNRTYVTDEKSEFTKRSKKQTYLLITDQNLKHTLRSKPKDRREACIRIDRKYVRSNSEERPMVKPCIENGSAQTMRRVSSHEDFSKANRHNLNKGDGCNQMRKVIQPLHERNTCSPEQRYVSEKHSQDDQEDLRLNVCSVGYESELYDENEHERRRNSERFAPQGGSRHPRTRRKIKQRTYHTNENNETVREAKVKSSHPHETHALDLKQSTDNYSTIALENDGDSTTPVTSSSDQSLQQDDNEKEQTTGGFIPTLDINIGSEESEPTPIVPTFWAAPSDERMESPHSRVVLSRKSYSTNIPPLAQSRSFIDLSAQMDTIKRKIKKYEEGFEREFGYKPSQADKLANPDTRKMCYLLNKLRKQVKHMKEEFKAANEQMTGLGYKGMITGEVVADIEKRLGDKRASASRPENVEAMNRDQLSDEKVSLQKALLWLEGAYGRPTSKQDRDMVRPLYDRYRAVKRALLRQQTSKMKESISELGTIHEHEAMDFISSSPPSQSQSSSPALFTSTPIINETSNATRASSPPPGGNDEASSDLVLENLHSLPRHELVELHRTTREEKKRLRRTLHEHELDFQAKTGRRFLKEDRYTLEPQYTEYKNIKAKLKFLEALIAKFK